jgi:hypothetical protein
MEISVSGVADERKFQKMAIMAMPSKKYKAILVKFELFTIASV